MARVVHYNIHAEDPEHTSRFYAEAFGWRLEKGGSSEDYVFSSAPGAEPVYHGKIRRGHDENDLPVTIRVPSVDESLTRVTASGGRVVMPKRSIPGVGHLAYCEDPEGNVFGVFSADSAAR
jgi:predicted enzyme related to lactoylglutathione lyase